MRSTRIRIWDDAKPRWDMASQAFSATTWCAIWTKRDWIARWHFLSARLTPTIPKPTRSWPRKWPSTRNGSSAFAVSIPISVRKLRQKSLDHCLGTLKLKGIKLHPEIEFFDPNEAELMEPIYVAARRYHVPIIFHTGMSSKASPGVIAELAAQHKDVPVILGHMGVSEYVKLAVAVARQNENIFLETSVVGWMPLLLEAFRGVGTSKILFGSDHPYNPLAMEVEKIAKHVTKAAKLKEDDLKKVFADNFLSILNHDR